MYLCKNQLIVERIMIFLVQRNGVFCTINLTEQSAESRFILKFWNKNQKHYPLYVCFAVKWLTFLGGQSNRVSMYLQSA